MRARFHRFFSTVFSTLAFGVGSARIAAWALVYISSMFSESMPAWLKWISFEEKNSEKEKKVNLQRCTWRSVSCISPHPPQRVNPCSHRHDRQRCGSCGHRHSIDRQRNRGIALVNGECPNRHRRHPWGHRRYGHQLRYGQDQYPSSNGMRPNWI